MYSSCTISDDFCLSNASGRKVLIIMTNTESSRAAEADCANMLAKPIPALCNLAISQGVFPNACKVAKLKPIFKKGKKTDPSNFIQLFPSIWKIIEGVTDDQANAFLSDEDILYNLSVRFSR